MPIGSNDRRKRVSLSPPLHTAPSWDEDALYQRLLEAAGIKDVTDNVASIGAPQKSHSELLVIDRILGTMLNSARSGIISRVLASINDMETAEERLRQGKIKAQKLWRALDPSVSPISKLPDELLMIIFEHGAAQEIVEVLQHDGSDADGVKTMVETALADGTRPAVPFSLLISHVCSNWRALALDKSTLWTRISPFWSVEQIRAWLERSRTQLIHIDMLDASGSVNDAAFDLLRAHLHRWVSVSIHIRSVFLSDGSEEQLMHDYADLLFDPSNGIKPLTALKHLSISSAVPVWFPSQIHGSEASPPILPQLERLRLQRASTDYLDDFFFRVVRAQVDLSGLFSWNWSGIGVAQQLQSLTIRSPLSAQDQENELEEPFTRWSLPTLRHLCIDWTPSGVCSSLLTLLRAPRLESLHLNLRAKDRRARRALTDFAAAHPSVTILQLYGFPSDAFKMVCPDEQSVQPFPRLRQLTLAKMPYLDFELEDVKSLRRFLITRKSLSGSGNYIRLHKLRLDRSILASFKDTDTSQASFTYVDELEDDDDYDSEVEDGTMTEGGSEIAETADEDGENAEVDAEDQDELEEDDTGTDAVELASISVGGSDDDDDEDGDSDGSEAGDEMEEGKEEEDELASNGSDEEDGEEWIRRHVEILEAVDFDWKRENP